MKKLKIQPTFATNWRSLHLLVTILLGIAMFFCPSRQASGAGILLNAKSGDIALTIEGEAPADAPDRERIARRSAIQEAVRSVIGEHVRSQSLVKDFTLIYDRVYTETKGFVKKVSPEGEPQVSNGSFHQKYSITVSAEDLDKTLVKSSIEAQVDIPALYSSIGSPRIALVVREQIIDQDGKTILKDPDLQAESIIQTYFKKRNAAFHFSSLPFLAKSKDQSPDWVALGHKNNFDVVIIGDITTRFSLQTAKKIRGIDKTLEIPFYRYASDLTLNIINVSQAERVNTVHAAFDKGDRESGSSQGAAQRFAKEKVLGAAIPDLFRQLMVGWVDTVYNTPYEIIFLGATAAEDYGLQQQLRGIQMISPEDLQSFGSTDGKLVYRTRVEGLLSELTHELTQAFSGWQVSESRQGKVVLNRSGSDVLVLRLEIRDVSFTESDDYLNRMKALHAVQAVTQPMLQEGNAVYTVTTSMTGRELAKVLEQDVKIRVTGLSELGIKAVKQ